MDVREAQCRMIVPLIVSWHAGTMRSVDRDAYEQHLLVCPPCMAQSDKAALALAALRAAGDLVPEPQFLAQLLERQRNGRGHG